MSIEINKFFNVEEQSKSYSIDKRIRLFDILSIQSAGDLTAHIHQELHYVNAYVDDGTYKTIGSEALQTMSKEKQTALLNKLYAQASEGIGFWYTKHQILDTGQNNLSQQILRWLNSEVLLNEIEKLTGVKGLIGADAQATRYYPGHFLTRHNDIDSRGRRRIAYVLNLTPDWHPDWGGLLQFYENNGDPKDTWVPTFNSLALFDVSHPHAVSYVAPFAKHPRLAITGWFITK